MLRVGTCHGVRIHRISRMGVMPDRFPRRNGSCYKYGRSTQLVSSLSLCPCWGLCWVDARQLSLGLVGRPCRLTLALVSLSR